MVPYISKDEIARRLPLIFPGGTPNRNNCISDIAAGVFFTMLYIDAVEGSDCYLGPKHVYCMSDEQAALSEARERTLYVDSCYKRTFEQLGDRWYADNTRESIRDDTIREALTTVGVVGSRDLPTTSPKPRYYLQNGISTLFDPNILDEEFESLVREWQHQSLTAGALARVQLVQQAAAAQDHGVLVRFPNQETRRMAAGASSVITKSVIEEFAPLFLRDPAVLWVSESGNKVVSRDDNLAQTIGLHIEADRNLPDLILVDLGTDSPLIVFVEVVASDGPVSQRRKEALLELTDRAGFERSYVVFVTAYQDRNAIFRRTSTALAWGSFAWFASEPQQLIVLSEQGQQNIKQLCEWV